MKKINASNFMHMAKTVDNDGLVVKEFKELVDATNGILSREILKALKMYIIYKRKVVQTIAKSEQEFVDSFCGDEPDNKPNKSEDASG